jgi:formylmethanofuran dehydrogenase subunit E
VGNMERERKRERERERGREREGRGIWRLGNNLDIISAGRNAYSAEEIRGKAVEKEKIYLNGSCEMC